MNAASNLIKTLTQLSFCGMLALGFLANGAEPAKVDGKWGWTTPGRQGGPERKMTLTLKAEGEKLTGKLATPGRNENVMETDITDGKVKGNEVSFTVTREFNGNKMVAKYNGKVEGDTLKGTVETERQGQARSRDWEAKRVKEEKK